LNIPGFPIIRVNDALVEVEQIAAIIKGEVDEHMRPRIYVYLKGNPNPFEITGSAAYNLLSLIELQSANLNGTPRLTKLDKETKE
jgi:hypothetical protein